MLGHTERAIRGKSKVPGIHRLEGSYPRNCKARQNSENIKIAQDLAFLPAKYLYRKKLEEKAPEIYIIGICSEPDFIVNAIADGSRTGHKRYRRFP